MFRRNAGIECSAAGLFALKRPQARAGIYVGTGLFSGRGNFMSLNHEIRAREHTSQYVQRRIH
jgi:hypothetical protein